MRQSDGWEEAIELGAEALHKAELTGKVNAGEHWRRNLGLKLLGGGSETCWSLT